MIRLPYSLALVFVAAINANPASAQHIDILTYDDNGQIDTGFIDVDSSQPQLGVRLFTETFDITVPGLFGTTAPGYFNNDSFPLLALSDLGFNALAITHPDTQVDMNLMYWDGLGAVDFGAPAAGTTLQFRLSSSTNISVDGSVNDVPGFVLEGTGPTGVLHKHISYSARGVGGADPQDGLYLTSIELTMPGLTNSEPVYLLFNAHYQRDGGSIVMIGDQPQVDPLSESLAVEWIEQNLLGLGGFAGDLDGDGFVGLQDLDIILGDWNQNVPPGDSRADVSGPGGVPDGFIGLDDLDVVLGNWNAGTPPAIAVPEPGVAGMLGLGGMLTMLRRRDRRK